MVQGETARPGILCRYDPHFCKEGALWEMRFVLLAILYMAGIFYASTLSGHDAARLAGPLGLPDYVLHAIAFAGLAVVWRLALIRGFRVSLRTAPWLALGICAVYGLSDEIHQSFVDGRDASATDLLADVVGAGVALIVAGWLSRRRSAKAAQQAG